MCTSVTTQLLNLILEKINWGFSNTSHVDSLDRFRISVVDEVKTDICILRKGCDSKENNMKIQFANEFIPKLGMCDTTTHVYQFIDD